MAEPKVTETKVVPEVNPRDKRYYVIVRHLLGAESERDNVIPVNDLGDHAHGRAACIPGKEVILSEVQINILKEAIEEYIHEVPDGSGIYESGNPLAEAKKHFPTFTAFYDGQTQKIMLKKVRPRFGVEIVKPFISAKAEKTEGK